MTQVFILAAGLSNRMYPLTKNKPKALLDIDDDNNTLLESQLNVLSKYDEITEVFFIVGYLEHLIEEKLTSLSYPNISLNSIYNPFYANSDNLISLWLAINYMNDDLIVLNGDNFITDVIVSKLLKEKSDLCVVVDRKNEYTLDDMKVITSENKVTFIGKQIMNDVNAESIGMIRFQNKGVELLKDKLLCMVKKESGKKHHWLETVQEIINDGHIVNYIEVPFDSWAEMDIHDDYLYMLKLVKNKIASIK